MAYVIIHITPNVYNKHTRPIVCSMEKFTKVFHRLHGNFHVKIGKLVMLLDRNKTCTTLFFDTIYVLEYYNVCKANPIDLHHMISL